MSNDPAIQLIANVVVQHPDGRVLLAKYDPDGENDDADAETRWWLPAHELDAYQHPDDAARQAVDEIGLDVDQITLANVQSFRGRRGWHLSFDYITTSESSLAEGSTAAWHARENLPPTMHGNWEVDTIDGVLGAQVAD